MQHEREQVFNKMVRENHASLYRICRAYLYDKSHTDDLYQEILFQLWKSLDNYKGTSKISTWVYRVAVNTAISYNIRNKKDRYTPLPDTLQVPAEDSDYQEKENKLNKLQLAVSKLEQTDRLIICLVLEDKSYKAIAEITGSSTNNIGVRINRIKGRLSKIMKQINNEF